MKYHYRIWCPDCLGEDPQGCFDGRVEDDEEEFDTPEQALDAGYEAINRTIWEFEVVDGDGKVIDVEHLD